MKKACIKSFRAQMNDAVRELQTIASNKTTTDGNVRLVVHAWERKNGTWMRVGRKR